MTHLCAGSDDPFVNDVRRIDTISNLREVAAPDYRVVFLVEGDATAGDGDWRMFYWDSSSTATDDGNTVVAPLEGGTGRWLRLTPIRGSVGSTDNRLVRSDGTGTQKVQATGITVSDSDEIDGYKGNINAQTGTTYTLQASDTGKILTFNNDSDVTVTIPPTLAAGWCATCYQKGAGQVTFSAGSGAALRNRSSHTKTAGQYAAVCLFVESNAGSAAVAVLAGDTAA